MGGVVSQNTNVAPEIAAYLDFNGAKMIEFARDDFVALTTGAISAGEFTRRFTAKSGRAFEEDLLTRFFEPELDRDVKPGGSRSISSKNRKMEIPRQARDDRCSCRKKSGTT